MKIPNKFLIINPKGKLCSPSDLCPSFQQTGLCHPGQFFALGCLRTDARSNEYLLQFSCPKFLIRFILSIIVSDPPFIPLFQLSWALILMISWSST